MADEAIVRTTDSSLWGRTVRNTYGQVIRFEPAGPDDDEGGAGVREPRRPRKPAPAAAVAVSEDEVVLT